MATFARFIWLQFSTLLRLVIAHLERLMATAVSRLQKSSSPHERLALDNTTIMMALVSLRRLAKVPRATVGFSI